MLLLPMGALGDTLRRVFPTNLALTRRSDGEPTRHVAERLCLDGFSRWLPSF